MKRSLFFLMAGLAMPSSCGTSKNVKTVSRPAPLALNMEVLRSPRAHAYINLDYGIKVKAYDNRWVYPSISVSGRSTSYASDKDYATANRVVSSTSDVKNTNSKYLGSTPYESTETFDIIGLTYNNSGNVQIEVTCEKNGFVTQKKRFNLRSVLDQKEVSTKFNLVKED